ncbi:hypothetical protein ACJMK2_041203 [Sinanodonta woodiana]|uniref:Selenoprotein P N-terminal domain-containing protein n=1 Tax=Sinanodonta woodiana TaxID=1069815 RepID=A0ABD3W3D6_SINWO
MSGPFGLLVLWLAAAIAVVGVDAEVCQLAPNWKVNGSLESYRQSLKQNGIDDIKFIIINSKDRHSRKRHASLARLVHFPIYQDSGSSNIWTLLDGGKDDILVYDKCGYLTFHVRNPRSLFYYNDTTNAISDTYLSNMCNCRLHDPDTKIPRRQRRSVKKDRHHENRRQNLDNARIEMQSQLNKDPYDQELLTNRISKCGRNVLCNIMDKYGFKYHSRDKKFVTELLKSQ